MNKVNWMQQGWECPKCGAVMSPHTDCCVNCRGNTNIFVTGTTTGNPPPTADVPPHNNITTSTSGPLDPPYVLKKDSHAEWWEKASLNGYKKEN